MSGGAAGATAALPAAVTAPPHRGRDASAGGWTVGRQAGRGQPGWKVDLIDLAELPLAINLGASAGTAELATRISDTAAILLVTCEYNHGYPASPKLAQQ